MHSHKADKKTIYVDLFYYYKYCIRKAKVKSRKCLHKRKIEGKTLIKIQIGGTTVK